MEEERRFHGYTWDDMNRVLDLVCDIEDRVEMTKHEEQDYDIAIQCVTAILNRMKEDKAICWD